MDKDNRDKRFDSLEWLEAIAEELGAEIVKPSVDTGALKDEVITVCKLIHMLYSGFQEVGFSEEQAWELLKISLNKN